MTIGRFDEATALTHEEALTILRLITDKVNTTGGKEKRDWWSLWQRFLYECCENVDLDVLEAMKGASNERARNARQDDEE